MFDKGAIAVATAIATCTSLARVDVRENMIGEDGGRQLLAAAKTLPGLQSFGVRCRFGTCRYRLEVLGTCGVRCLCALACLYATGGC